MEYKELGDTGVQVPEIGLGTWEYRGGVEPLRRGIDLGATLIDTAEEYGTEEVVGRAVRGIRDRVFIATKVSGSHLRYDQVLRAAEQSLKRLGMSCIDLYQVHWPDPRVPIRETMRAMETLVDAGKVRFIGVSNFSLKELQEAQEALPKHRIVCNQVLYSLLDREIEADLLSYCQRAKVTVMAYSPLARGRLASKPGLRPRLATTVLQDIARETGKSVAQVALNWCTAKPGVVAIPKADKTAHVEDDCGASDWRLTDDQVAALDRAFV